MKTIESLYLIDDDDTFQFLAQRTIEETKIVKQIRIFSNGKEAIDFLEKTITNLELLPEVILLDLSMPIMDGWGFLENFLLLKPRIGKKIYIYIVSSSINPSDLERAQAISEVTDYVVKPITKDKFIALIKNL
jgi:CheY-like chemotaxis protein